MHCWLTPSIFSVKMSIIYHNKDEIFMRLLEIPDIQQLIQKVGLNAFYLQLCDTLREDFSQWQSFDKSPRPAAYVANGVIELMPICGKKMYSFKYVNGHP